MFALYSQARIITCWSIFFSSSSLGPSLAALLHVQVLHFNLPAVILFTIPWNVTNERKIESDLTLIQCPIFRLGCPWLEEMNEVTPCRSRKGFKPNYRILYTEQESERGQWTSEVSSHSRVVLVSFAPANSGKFSALWGLWELHRAWIHWSTFPRNCNEPTGTI